MYWPYKSFCWKCYCVCDVLSQRSFCWKFLCVCDVLSVLAQKSFCWEFLCVCVCVMYWLYKVFVGNVAVCVMYWPKEVFVGNFCVCVWCTGCTGPKKFLLGISLCVWCTGPIKVFVGNVSLRVCVLYWPYKSLCWKCFSVCDVLAL